MQECYAKKPERISWKTSITYEGHAALDKKDCKGRRNKAWRPLSLFVN